MPSKAPLHYSTEMEGIDAHTESGYASGSSSEDYVPEIVFTKPHLQFLNRQLQFLEPQGKSRLMPIPRLTQKPRI